MLLNERGFSFTNFLDEFGHSIFGSVDEFGFYVDTGGSDNFNLLAESSSDFSITFTINKLINLLAPSSSDFSIILTLSQEIINLLAESSSDFSLLFYIETLFDLLAESNSDSILILSAQLEALINLLAESSSDFTISTYVNSNTSLLAESSSDFSIVLTSESILLIATSNSNAIVSVSPQSEGYIDALLASSLSDAVTSPLFNSTCNTVAVSLSSALASLATLFSTTNPITTSTSSFYITVTPELIGYLGNFPCISTSSSRITSIYTYDYIIYNPLTEEGFNVVDSLTEFGEYVVNSLTETALTSSGKYVFYTVESGLNFRAISDSLAKTKLRYQHFQYPYIIIFDSNYNLVSVEDINTGKFIEVKDNNKFTLDINI